MKQKDSGEYTEKPQSHLETPHDKEREAVALKYDAGMDRAPMVTALGRGYLADCMLKAAYNNGIQVIRDDKVSSVLQKLRIGDEIPEQLYKAVAEILIFISMVDEDLKQKFGTLK